MESHSHPGGGRSGFGKQGIKCKSMAAPGAMAGEATYKVGRIPLRLGEWVVAHDLAWVYDIHGGTKVERI